VADLPVRVPVVRQVALVRVPAVVVQVLVVVLVPMMAQKYSSPYQFVEDLAVLFSDAYYRTLVFLFLSWQRTHQFFCHTILRAHHLLTQGVLPVGLRWTRIKIGRSSSLVTQFFNYGFFVCNNITEDTIPHFLIFIHHLICLAQCDVFIKGGVDVGKEVIILPFRCL
jgi:hypothetical protein